MVETGDVEGCAQTAWEAYYEEYVRRFTNRPPRIGNAPRTNKLYKAFIRIANICIGHEFDVRDYIVFCFEHIEKDRLYITPNDFIKLNFIDEYKKMYSRDNSNHIEQDYKGQIKMLARYIQQIDTYSNEKEVLISANNPFYAWFRIFYMQTLDDTLVKYYGKSAYNELRSDRMLREFVRKIRPDSLKQFEALFGIFGD